MILGLNLRINNPCNYKKTKHCCHDICAQSQMLLLEMVLENETNGGMYSDTKCFIPRVHQFLPLFPLVLTPYHTCTKRLANVRTRLHRCSKWNPGLPRWPDPKGMSLKIIAFQVCSYDDHHVSRTFKIKRNNLDSSICTLVGLL